MSEKNTRSVPDVTVRFAGDSGDGMQLAGTQFTDVAAHIGNDISTFPDFPAEIRAPAGTLAGVSGFQIHIGDHDIHTPGDAVDVLVAMNPAALKANLADVREQGMIVVNTDAFTKGNLRKAGYAESPLEDESLAGYRLVPVPITKLNKEAVKDCDIPTSSKDRCKNLFALGIMLWMYDRPTGPVEDWLKRKFAKKPELAEANTASIRAGFNFGNTTDLVATNFNVKRAEDLPKGTYRKITGNEAAAIGFVVAARRAKRPLVYASYPITPASDILHFLAARKEFDVRTIQAEDEIAAVAAAIGASFGGAIGMTGTAGPGLVLKAEAMGLAVMTELPLIVLDVQRGGPSTGLPTKTEQSDLFAALHGRHGECPVAVVAPTTASDCFDTAIEAVRIATKYMTPVIYLSDGFLANTAEPWQVPQVAQLPDLTCHQDLKAEGYSPYKRDPETLARSWATPGMAGMEHRIGGLEKEDGSGNVNYEAENHAFMVGIRASKIAGIANDIPPASVEGDESGSLLVVGWGSTYGAITAAVRKARDEGRSVSHMHIRHLNPLPANVGDVMAKFDKVLMPECNLGQLREIVRSQFLVDVVGLNKVEGKPFHVSEIYRKIVEMLGDPVNV